ncbi:MAG: ribonuclease H-like domain-containing protein [Monoraphidium minutum]|nr:MAG: ribonuclease H-like domain-containing protein [Monoraphidium minutum]
MAKIDTRIAALCAASAALGWSLAHLQSWIAAWRAGRSQGRLAVRGRPLVTLDLETTGLRVRGDRIIEIVAIKLMPDGRVLTKGPQRVDPRMPISPESSSITGIQDGDVAGVAPAWADVAGEWREFLEGCVLHGYNAKRFDVPLLRAEFARVGVADFPPLGVPVVDSCRLFFRQGAPRPGVGGALLLRTADGGRPHRAGRLPGGARRAARPGVALPRPASHARGSGGLVQRAHARGRRDLGLALQVVG